MNIRLAIATGLMIITWAVVATRFQPSPIPTVEQLLPPHSLEDSKLIRARLKNRTQFTLLNLPEGVQAGPRQRLLSQLQESITGVHILCISSITAGASSIESQPNLSECKRNSQNPPDLMLLWRNLSKQSSDPDASLYQEIESAVSEILPSAVARQSQLFAPEMVRAASWRAAAGDIRTIAPLLAAIIVVVPLLAFRSATAPAFIFLTAATTTTATLLLFTGGMHSDFNALLLAVIPLVWAVSSMDAAHLVERIDAHRRRGLSMPFNRAVRELAAPCAVTTATTFIGFGALTLQGDSPLLHSFGTTAAAGTLLAILFTFLFGWLLLNHQDAARLRPYTINPLARLSHGIVKAALRHPVAILVLWICLALSVTPYVTQLQRETPFPNIFSPGTAMHERIESLQQLLASDLRPLTLYLVATDEQGAQKEPMLHALGSTSDYVGKLPESRLVLPAAIIRARCAEGCADQETPITQAMGLIDDSGVARIDILFARHSNDRQREIGTWLEHFDQTMLGHHRLVFDGPGYLYPRVELLGVAGAVSGMLWSLFGVVLILWLVLRNRVQVAAASLSTLLPLWLVAGFMGAFDIDWSLALLGVPAMLFGLAVDDTIHLLWHRKPRASPHLVLRRNALRSGAALTSTTLMLCLCISTLLLSSLHANQEIAILLALGMSLALLLDLTLLPATISLLRRRSPR